MPAVVSRQHKQLPMDAAKRNSAKRSKSVGGTTTANNGPKSSRQSVANQQSIFTCHLCPYEALSVRIIESHLAVEHNQPIVMSSMKLESVDDATVSSSTFQEIQIKSEPDSLMPNYGIFARIADGGPQTHADFVDLTLDDWITDYYFHFRLTSKVLFNSFFILIIFNLSGFGYPT